MIAILRLGLSVYVQEKIKRNFLHEMIFIYPQRDRFKENRDVKWTPTCKERLQEIAVILDMIGNMICLWLKVDD